MSDYPTGSYVESTFLTERPSPWSTALGAVALVATFGAAAGPPGVVAGVATALLWYGFGTPYAVAVGHVLLLALFPDGIDPISFVIVEAGLVTLLVVPVLRSRAPLRTAAGTLLAVAGLGAVSWLAVVSLSLWQAAGVTAGAVALASYGAYRYGLVALGLVDDEPSSTIDE
ncbi:hypothetical protein QA600_13955 [Natronococcus sp. A-GB1]|uniref:hypothetical protein n=1 Tax=Natronococcus sp. A-GB1 TaxID=3037648 RepID=UPI00241D4128|nr:hypothetical protein [Natronococcus sp. A-GB1]MDG5760441.1 hypothetical protein [Natronococcus sp. A-GB1]